MITALYRIVVVFLLTMILWLLCLVCVRILDQQGIDIALLLFRIATGIAVLSLVVVCIVMLIIERRGSRGLDERRKRE